ncbi:hypothetical protein V8F20_001377 [Naviculisporaceae sp. PSN 640]
MLFTQLAAAMLSLTITATAIPTDSGLQNIRGACSASDSDFDTKDCYCYDNGSLDVTRTDKCCPDGHLDEAKRASAEPALSPAEAFTD